MNNYLYELNNSLQYAFTVSNTNIMILDGYMMALYKHVTGNFLFFDSHSRDENGLMTPEGTSVALIFSHLQALHDCLLQLIASLNVNFFAIIPIVIHSSVDISKLIQLPKAIESAPTANKNIQSQPTINPEDIPGCSTWNDNEFNSSIKSQSYRKWFNSLCHTTCNLSLLRIIEQNFK